MKFLQILVLLLAALCVTQAFAASPPKDATGCRDSPLVGRFPGSTIKDCANKADDAHQFDIGTDKPTKKNIEGEYHMLSYAFPKDASKAQVLRNIHTALQNAGYTFEYDSGAFGNFTVHQDKTWIEEDINAADYQQYIVSQTQLTQEVVANAAALSSGLASTGHQVVNGILFDTAKADVKPESAAALQEVAKLLKQDPGLKLYVVGHTDNVGSVAANVELSRQRAAAVVRALTTQYGVPANRLLPYGDGPYAPVTSNDNEDGRTRNRRVEIVKQ
jgi:OOP family OmpA-OmpF porin